jgi:hypothetical protein
MNRSSSYDPTKPKYEWGSKWQRNGITEKQIGYIENLCGQLKVQIRHLDMNRGDAMRLIDELKRYQSGDPHSPRYLNTKWSKYVAAL